jgi:hypothetical protein
MYKYQNVSEIEQTIVADGNINPRIVKAGETVLSDVPIENPNFQFVGEEQDPNKVQGVITQDQPGAITEAQRLDNTNKEIK